ncbi:MAG TPA: cytosine deaminase [Rhabdaerophilum sp.]|nr:cytosine deaminase [Rhabdaerophilum sp.]
MQVVLPQGRYWLDGFSVSPALTRIEGPVTGRADGLATASLLVENGRIARIVAGTAPDDGAPRVEGRGRMLLPRFVEVHTHLDKGQVHHRAPNPNGTFLGAREAVMADREANWSAEDVRARMDFALRCALHHGTGAIRTHLDSIGKQTAISWSVFDEMRAVWKGRIALQAVCLFPVIKVIDEPEEFAETVRHVRCYGGILGAVTFLGEPLDGKLDAALDIMIGIAKAEGLDLDFHVDESDSPDARSLEVIADALIRHRFGGRALAGHCCSLALMDDRDRARVIDKLGTARLNVVSLPMCNMYLQDRVSGRTPRWRGVAPLHELDAAGISTMVSSDNTRDAFYAYGDLDVVEVYREATRILHFDHSERPWLETISTRPADQMGLAGKGRLAPGLAADLIIFPARTMNEFLSRPQVGRAVLIDGKAIDTSLPDYAELDAL